MNMIFNCLLNPFNLNMVQEKFNIKWDTYTDHLREMLYGMMTSDELTDVTLVSEDKSSLPKDNLNQDSSDLDDEIPF